MLSIGLAGQVNRQFEMLWLLHSFHRRHRGPQSQKQPVGKKILLKMHDGGPLGSPSHQFRNGLQPEPNLLLGSCGRLARLLRSSRAVAFGSGKYGFLRFLARRKKDFDGFRLNFPCDFGESGLTLGV